MHLPEEIVFWIDVERPLGWFERLDDRETLGRKLQLTRCVHYADERTGSSTAHLGFSVFSRVTPTCMGLVRDALIG